MNKIFIITILTILLLVGVASAAPVDFATDDFECGGFTCGSGWTSGWTYTGTCEIETQNAIDSYNMRGLSGCDATKTFDASAYNTLTVSFYATARSLENNEYCRYYYYDGTTNHEILTLTNGDDDNSHDPYTFDVTSYGISANSGIRMYGATATGDYCYIDNVIITGEATTEINLFTAGSYQGGSSPFIDMSSSLTNTQHTLELYQSDGTLFCNETRLSPSVPMTSFSTQCTFPDIDDVDAYGIMYVTGTPSDTVTEYFNISQPVVNPDDIKIERVYFSSQVLQGGNTEIFALLELGPGLDVDSAIVTLTFPDLTTRDFSMHQTANEHEYRAFITDTFQTGSVLFTIRVETGVSFDTYSNQYNVAPYNVDFVNLVNLVGEVLNVRTVQNVNETTLQVHGTEYTAEDRGKVFIQVLDGNSQPNEDASCYASIYYPDNQPFKYKQLMTYVDEGLYNYNFNVPYPAGVYMVASYCYISGLNSTGKQVNDNFESGGISGGTGWSGSWILSGAAVSSSVTHTGTYSLLISDDDSPSRDFTSTVAYESIDISFWWRASSIEGGEYAYFYIDDASSTSFLLETITDGDDDGVWHHSTTTLYLSPDGFDFDGSLTFRGTTSGNWETGDYLYFDDINISLNAPSINGSEQYQIIRGSGEVHVVSQNGVYETTLNMGELKNDTFLESFIFHYDVISQTAVDLEDRTVHFLLWKPFPCDHVTSVVLRHANGSATALEYVTGLDVLERCVINARMDLDVHAIYDVEVTSENYWKTIFLEDFGTMLLEEEMINISCQNYVQVNGLANFTVPLVDASINPMFHDALWQSCQSYLDTSYHIKEVSADFFPFINTEYNFTYEEMSGLESSYMHFKSLKGRLEGYANTIFNGLNLGNSYSVALIADPTLPLNPLYAKYFAGVSTSYLNYGQTAQIPGNVWNYENRTLTSIDNISVSINTTQVATDVWEYNNRTLTNASNIAGDIWGTNSTINPGIIGQLVDSIWNYVARYIHGEEQ